jgi:hypothetical protein
LVGRVLDVVENEDGLHHCRPPGAAATTLLALAQLAADEPGTTVSWAIRSGTPARTYRGQEADALPARGALGSRVHALVDSGRINLHLGFSVARMTPPTTRSPSPTAAAKH